MKKKIVNMSSSIESILQISESTTIIFAFLNTDVGDFEILKKQFNYNIGIKRFRIEINYKRFNKTLNEKKSINKNVEGKKFHRRIINIFYFKVDASILTLMKACDCLNEEGKLLKQQYKDIDYIVKHHLILNLVFIILINCNDDVDIYIRAIMINKKNKSNGNAIFLNDISSRFSSIIGMKNISYSLKTSF